MLNNIKNNKIIVIIIIIIIIILMSLIVIKYKMKENFNEEQNNKNDKIILYYSSHCGYSIQFLPEWKKFKKYVIKNMPHLEIQDIKCEGDKEIYCMNKNIRGYPTVMLYKSNGEEIMFNDSRSMGNLIRFVKKNMN